MHLSSTRFKQHYRYPGDSIPDGGFSPDDGHGKGIIDLQGNVWCHWCKTFAPNSHRVHRRRANCTQSDLFLVQNLRPASMRPTNARTPLGCSDPYSSRQSTSAISTPVSSSMMMNPLMSSCSSIRRPNMALTRNSICQRCTGLHASVGAGQAPDGFSDEILGVGFQS